MKRMVTATAKGVSGIATLGKARDWVVSAGEGEDDLDWKMK